MMSQKDISQEQAKIQKKQVQPIFSIFVYQQQDLDDGKYGTEILEVRNIGAKVLDVKIDTDVFFRITRHEINQNDTIYFEISDYFNMSYSDNKGSDLIETALGTSSNRMFSKEYQKAIKASHDGIIYFLDKIILSKITYRDILNEKHTIYFEGKNEIEQSLYDSYFNFAKKSSTEGLALRNISFEQMKTLIDELVIHD